MGWSNLQLRSVRFYCDLRNLRSKIRTCALVGIADGEAAIPRFYFNQATRQGYIEDPDGSELPDLEAARAEAILGARHLWAAAIVEGKDLTGERFEVSDEDGRVVLEVPFVDALPPGLRLKPSVM